MSEDDRQAKAARAKALLKKRQQGQQKATGKHGISSPSPPPSRTFTPTPSDLPPSSSPTIQTDGQGLRDVFGKASDGDGGTWLNTLTRVDTFPPPQTPEILSLPPQSSAAVNSPTLNLVQGLRSEMQRQQNTISVLESEKRSLIAETERYKSIVSSSRGTEESLQQERLKTKSLSENIHQLEAHLRSGSDRAEEQQRAILALQAERNALLGSLERLKGAESSKQQTEARLQQEISKNSELSSRIHFVEASVQDASAKIVQHQQTISLLVTEKTTLTTSLERLEQLEPRAQELEGLLHAERTLSSNLQANVQHLEASLTESAARVAALFGHERELHERCRELERELQLTNGSLNDLQAESDRYQRKAEELEERIQNDDRVEKLESILQSTQDRTDELEFQLSKIKQVHTALKSEHDGVQSQLRTHISAASELKTKHAQLEAHISATEAELSSTISERDSLLHDNADIKSQVDKHQISLAELQQKLSQAAIEFAANSRQLQNAQNEARKANRRAEEAEKMQSDLQAEGMTLMRSLEEMRPKIVELTNIRLEFVDKVENLESTIRKKEDLVSLLESNLEDAREKEAEAEKLRQRADAMRKKDEFSSQDSLSQMQKAYGELQAELEVLMVNIGDREAERDGYHHLALRRLEEVDRLTFSLQAQSERLVSAEKELDERRLAQTEDNGFVEGMQNEIEALRSELALREEELERLREPSSDLVQSLDGEMVSALKQQQTLELSSARSQIRALESAVFESDARAHTLQKQVSTLMDQLTQLRSLSHTPTRPFSPTPGLPARPSSRAHNVSDELRRASLATPKPVDIRPKPSPRRTFDSLSPETRHKRRVSLGMLKARIDSEVASTVGSDSPSRTLTSLPEAGESIASTVMHPSEPHHIRGFRRHQFLDESHIFWCNSCHGDLVIL